MTDREFLAMEISTTVRSLKQTPAIRVVRAGHRVLSALAPEPAAARAERMFLTPPRSRRPAWEIDLLASAEARPMRVGQRRIETWTWGTGPSVLLVHGWGGRGTQLGAFVAPLVAHGFSVVTFDAPGHGASDPGLVIIPEIIDAIRTVATSRGRLAGLVAHSAGALTAAHALHDGLAVDAAVFIGPPADLHGAAARFTEVMGFSRAVRERMRERIADRVGRPWSDFDVTARTAARPAPAPLLVVHDRGDAEVPWQQGMAITRAWRGADMLMTDGLGHRRILRDSDVVATAVAFVIARTAERGMAALTASAALDATPLETLLAG
jgi:pimeloyl-ACP methyl ester carboxylesterase